MVAPVLAGPPRARSSPTGIPVWLSYPAGMLPGSRLLDGPPHHITPAEVVKTSKDYEFVVLFTSTVGFHSDLRMARAMKEQKPDIKIAFVGPHVQIKPAESLLSSSDLDLWSAANLIMRWWNLRRANPSRRLATRAT